MDYTFFIFPLISLILIFVAGVIGIRRILKSHYRINTLRTFANSLNLHYRKAKVHNFEWEYPGFDFLQKGEERYAFNIVSGDLNGRKVKGFDYHYQTNQTDSGSDETTIHFYFSAIIITSSFTMKPLTIRPEALFDKLTAAFGWDDINFESAEFSRKFHVKAEDRRWAYEVLTPMTIEYLLESPQYEVQMNNQHLAVRGKSQFEPSEFEKAFEIGETMLNGIPKFAKS